MKRILLLVSSVVMLGLASATANETNPPHGGEVDVKASTITWQGKKVVGKHTGTINLKAGGLKFENHKLVGGHFIIDMTSLACTDLQAGRGKEKLERHLKSTDFFQVEEFPTAEFIMTEAVNTGGNKYKLMGILTIKGESNPIEFEAEVKVGSATSVIDVDRTIYGIKYGSGSFFDNLGDKAIDNSFQLTVNLVLK